VKKSLSRKYRLVAVDDHALFRRGLIGLLNEMADFEVVGEASDGNQAVYIVRQTHPDLVLLDVNMPLMGGVETLREIRREQANVPVVMLTVSQDDDALLGAILGGANGYLLKNAEPETLRQVLLRVLHGEAVLAPEVTAKVFLAVQRMQNTRQRILLTDREMEILRCMMRGLTTSGMAKELFVSENTVKTHVRHILAKLKARNRAEAVAKATELKLL
jgi:DNA-binding NarL/FixJ family response regulator